MGRRVLGADESQEVGSLCRRDALGRLLQTLSGACEGHEKMGYVLSWRILGYTQFCTSPVRCLLKTHLVIFFVNFGCLNYGKKLEEESQTIERTSSFVSLQS